MMDRIESMYRMNEKNGISKIMEWMNQVNKRTNERRENEIKYLFFYKTITNLVVIHLLFALGDI